MGEEKSVNQIKTIKTSTRFFLAPIIFSIAVLVVCLGIVVLVYSIAESNIKKTAETTLNAKVSYLSGLIEKKVDLNIGVLYSIRSFFVASKLVQRDGFRDFVKIAGVLERYPNVSSVSFVQVIGDKDKDRFVADVVKDISVNPQGYPNFTIYPEGASDEYYVVKYIEPGNEVINRALGFNYRSDAFRRLTAEKARDTGLPQISPLIKSVATGKYSHSSVLAIYKNDLKADTIAERQGALDGFAILTINAAGLIEDVLSEDESLRDFDLRVLTNDADGVKTIIFEDVSNNHGSSTKVATAIGKVHLGDREWVIELTNSSSKILPLERNILFAIIVAGILISLLVTAVVHQILSSKERALRLANKMSHNLTESEQRYRGLYESSSDAIMTLEPPDWRFTHGNLATIKMFNCRDEKEFTNMRPGDLSPERQTDGSLSSEKALIMTKKALAEGSNFFEWIHRRCTGENFFATVLLTRIGSGSGAFLQATVRDISKQKQAEEALKEQMEETERINKLMVGRELEMIKLKERVEQLENNNRN